MKTAGRAAGERLIDLDHVRQDFVLHLDQPRRVDRAFFGVGRNRRDLVALKHDRVALRVRRISPHERRLDARRLLRRRQIDRHDPRVRMRRPDDPAVEHAGTIDVEGVLRAAGDLVGAVEPLDVRADHGCGAAQ